MPVWRAVLTLDSLLMRDCAAVAHKKAGDGQARLSASLRPRRRSNGRNQSWNGMRNVRLMSEASSVSPIPRLVTTEVLSFSA